MDADDWFGLATVLAVIIAGLVGAFYAPSRAGRQRIAESRLKWGERHRQLSIETNILLTELERLIRLKKYPVRQRKLSIELRAKAVELLLMINPESKDEAARAEGIMERDLLTRLTIVGVSLDMNYIKMHRAVLKHAWRQAKTEF